MGEIQSIAFERTIIADGAIATMLMEYGLGNGQSPEAFMLEKPEALARIHRDYRLAGADILTANTFGASRVNLATFGLENRVYELCKIAISLAKSAGDGLVAGSIGPVLSKRDLESKELHSVFAEQAQALEEGGADLIIIETMTDIEEAKIALIAAKEITKLPIIVQVSIANDSGGSKDIISREAAIKLGLIKPFGIGSNCGRAPSDMIDIIAAMRAEWGGVICAEPSAGLPSIVDGKPIWHLEPEEMADIAVELERVGANIIGSCCGSTPEHTNAIVKKLSKM